MGVARAGTDKLPVAKLTMASMSKKYAALDDQERLKSHLLKRWHAGPILLS
jgi:hypothetical protein